MSPASRLVIAACDPVMQRLFVPVARELRRRGHEVTFFTPFRRERAWLRRSGESPAPDRLADSAAPLPSALRRHVNLRAEVGELLRGPRLDAFARAVSTAARDAVREADVAVVWNGGDLVPATVAHHARASRTALLHCESGLFPRTLQMDPEGVNAASAAARAVAASWPSHAPLALPETPSGGAAGAEPPRPLRWWWTLRELVDATIDEPTARFSARARLRDIWRRDHHRRAVAGDAAPLPARYALVPLQVHDDTQIVFHGRWVDSMRTLLRAAAAACDAVGIALVVREHPVETGRIDHAPLRAEVPRATWTRTRSLDETLEGAAVVVTANSTVGLEALRAGRPVVICGRAVYGVPGLTHAATSAADVPRALAAALASPPSPGDVARLLGAIHRELHVDVDWRDPDPASVRRVADRIELAGPGAP